MRLRLALYTALLALYVSGSNAQSLRIEILPLAHQSAEEILPVLRPLVPKPGSISAYQGRLVIKSTDGNIRELRSLLDELDRAPRNLLITVRQGALVDRQLDGARGFGEQRLGDITISAPHHRLGQGGGVTITNRSPDPRAERWGVRALSTRARRDAPDHRQIRVLEGREAFISAGEEVPVANQSLLIGTQGGAVQQSIEYKSAQTGFYVRARITEGSSSTSGSGGAAPSVGRVHIDVTTHRTHRRRTNGGAFSTSSAYTTLSAPLDTWVQLGGNVEHTQNSEGSRFHHTRSVETAISQIFIKVQVAR